MSSALNKAKVMEKFPRGHNWATEPGGEEIDLKVHADPTANPRQHSESMGRHRGPKCVRCGEHPCWDCGMVVWSARCPDFEARPTPAPGVYVPGLSDAREAF